MAKKIIGGLAVTAALFVILAVVYHSYFKAPPPAPPQELPYRTAPTFTGKPATSPPAPSPAPEPSVSPQAKAAGPPAEAPVPSEHKPPRGVEPELEKQYGLFLGRYRTYRQAAKVMEKIKNQGTPAFVRHEGRKKRLPYEVWAGPFSDEKQAQAAAQSVRKNLKMSARLQNLQMPVPK